MQPPYQATSKENRTNTGKKTKFSQLADSEMLKVLMAHMETNMMTFHTMARLIISGRPFVRKCTKHMLTLWGTQPGNTRIGLMTMMLRFYHCLRKGVGHMMHFFPNRQETANFATCKQNLNSKKATSNTKCLMRQEI